MPVNPMQRRVRNSFLGGFLVALILMALVIVFLLFQMKKLQEEKKQLLAMQKSVLVAADDLESGESITFDSFIMQKVQVNIDSAQIVSEDDFSFLDKNGNIETKYNNDGSIKEKQMIMKIDVPAGTIVTKDMITESADEIADDVRIEEFNMIALPSELETGDYIDIRFTLDQGQDYIVLSKKKVIKSTQTGIWIKLTEQERLILNNAIVENYRISDSVLRAVIIPEPGIQEALETTYPVSATVLELINNNPNIIQEAKNALINRYNANNQAIWNQRLNSLDPILSIKGTGSVESGIQEELSKIQESREEYISSLGQ